MSLIGTDIRRGYIDAAEKLAAFLIDHCNEEQPQAPLTGLPQGHGDLASLFSMSRETPCRSLSKFRLQSPATTDPALF